MEKIKVVVDVSKDGNFILKGYVDDREFLFSSKYFPLSEAEKLVDRIEVKNPTVVVVGAGNPYVIYFLSKRYSDRNIVVLEPFESVFSTLRSHKELSRLISSSNVRLELVESEFKLVEILGEIGYFDLYVHPQYRGLFSFIQDWEKVIKKVMGNLEINRNTLKRFGNVWVKNLLLSIHSVIKTKGVRKLFGAFGGMDAVVVGAGPSLDRDIERLKLLYQSCVVISVDTSWGYLVSNSVIPDIVVTVDPQLRNFIYILQSKCYGDTIFVCDSMYSAIIYDFVPTQNVFTFDSPLKLWNLVKREFGIEKGEVMVGGSVVCSAIDLANRIGCSRVLLFGVDLSFPRKRVYAKGNFCEVENFISSNVFSPYDGWKLLSRYPLLERISKSKVRVFTDPRMLTFKEWMESYVRENGVRLINLSNEGLRIEGEITLEDAYVPKNNRDRITEVKSSLIGVEEGDRGVGDASRRFRERVGKIIKVMDEGGIQALVDLLEKDELLKSLIELGLQSILLGDYSEEDFLAELRREVEYLRRLQLFTAF
ncbi:MAG: 6-hydroxymethylpterin diphosphokinase MptE-like protein [Brevinematia bacterium]